jgi:hypothetical protein
MAPKKDQGLDLKALTDLAEPLSLFMNRMMGNATEPVALPALARDRTIDPNATPGTGWTRDDVVKLTPWVQDFWTGAGTYSVQVLDQNKKLMEFEFTIRQDDRVKQRSAPPLGQPGIVPPSAIQHMQLGGPPVPQGTPQAPMTVQPPPPIPMQWGSPQYTPMQGTFQPPPAPPSAWGAPSPFQQPQQVYPPQPQQGYGVPPYGMPPGYQQPYGQPPYNPWGPLPGGMPQRDNEGEKALKALQAEIEAGKRREIELKYAQDLDRTRAEHQKQIDKLSDEMRRNNEQGANKENDEVRRAREERERMERERERERTDARFQEMMAKISELASARANPNDDAIKRLEEDARRRDEQHARELEKRDQIAREERIRLEIKESNDKHERMMREITANANKGPDPVLEFMKESAREARASQERIAAIEARRFDAMQAASISPMQLVTLMDKRDSSGDQFIRNMMPALTGVIDLYRGAAENVVGLAGGGPAAAWQPALESVISTGKEVMDRYFTWKRDEGVSANKVKIAQAQAQGQAASAAAQAQQAIAHMQTNAARGNNGVSQQASAPAAGLAGAEAPAAAAQANNVVPIRQPPTEAERFGKAYESVKRLREGVKKGDLTPNATIDAIMQGVNAVISNNQQHPPGDPAHVIVPVFTLYEEERWADFIDQLLPDAPVPFKEECVKILIDPEPDDGSAPKDPDLEV